MNDIAYLMDRARGVFATSGERCTSCGSCVERCGLLAGTGWDVRTFCEESLKALGAARTPEELREGLAGHAELYRFVRTCLGCNRCTSRCPEQLSMSVLRAQWRDILRAGGYIADAEVAGLLVDCTWDIFSIYRAVQGIGYGDLPLLQVAPVDADRAGWVGAPERPRAETLFFPGCTLCTYAPELTRAAFAWLQGHVGPCLLATQCCASTLEGVGEGQRAAAWKRHVIEAARDQGVSRIVTVCPGCKLRLAPAVADIAPDMEFVSLPQLLADAGVRVQAQALAGCALPVSVVDSCQDRAGDHGPAIRRLFQDVESVPFPGTGNDAWCCGASGSVNSVDPRFVRVCTLKQLERGAKAGAGTLITACPTCAYTYAYERWANGVDASSPVGVDSLNYLEAVFGMRIDWPAVFHALGNLWTGEHADWALEKLLPR